MSTRTLPLIDRDYAPLLIWLGTAKLSELESVTFNPIAVKNSGKSKEQRVRLVVNALIHEGSDHIIDNLKAKGLYPDPK